MAKKNEVALIRRGETALVRRADPKEEFITAVCDIFEMPDAFVVKLDMPGSSKEGVSVTVESDILTVRGMVKSLHRETVSMLMREIVALSYYRVFNLGKGLNADRTQAEFEDGVLTLTIPKADNYKERRISIS